MRLSLSLSAWLFCVAIATVASQSGCTSSQSGPGGSTDTKRIIFLTNGDDPFWDGAEEGLNLAAKELDLEAHGLVAVQDRGDFTAPTQIERLNQYAAASDIAAVVADPWQAAADAGARAGTSHRSSQTSTSVMFTVSRSASAAAMR